MERGIEKSGIKRTKLHVLRRSHIYISIEMGFVPVDILSRVG